MKGGPKSFLHQALRLFVIVFVHNCNFVRKEHISFYLKIIAYIIIFNRFICHSWQGP